ncbi:hypothetical protein OG21DRAFT_1491752 [Imleria badia]|nr:hypothetical protein OG21DRAFT_1491752 [Imleria badia]
MSTTSKLPHIPEECAVEDWNRFTVPQIVALHSTPFAQGFSKELRHVAIRAILRHGVHRDGMHYDLRKRGGLHPAYISFNPSQIGEVPFCRTALKQPVLTASTSYLQEASKASASSSEEWEFSKRTRLGIPALRSWPLYTR